MSWRLCPRDGVDVTPSLGLTLQMSWEKYPHLLQHAYNPVDWYLWGHEAFEKARQEDKPTEKHRDLNNIGPFIEEYKTIEGRTTAYICEGFSCQPPITDLFY